MNVYLAIALGAACGGFVQGFSGFAFGMVAMGFWAWALEPTLAGPLVVLCSLLGQLIHLRPAMVRQADPIAWRFLGAGLLAIPLGVLTLQMIDPHVFRLGVGAVLVISGSFSILRRDLPLMRNARSIFDPLIGAAGGFLGGCCGLVGPIPALWCACKPMDRMALRNALQIFFSAAHLVTCLVYLARGLISGTTLACAAFAFVFMFGPVRLGARLYGRLGGDYAQRAIFLLLIVVGAVLLISNR